MTRRNMRHDGAIAVHCLNSVPHKYEYFRFSWIAAFIILLAHSTYAIPDQSSSGLSSSPSSTATAACVSQTIQPLVIPIQNVTLSNGAVRRGVSFNVGTPPQPFALWVNGGSNYTYLYDDSDSCSGNNLTYCISNHGGVFDKSKSSTWSPAAGLTALGLDNNTWGAYNGDVFGTDTVGTGPSVNLSSYPFGIWRPGTVDSNSLGLASNSTFMDFLRRAKAIGSSTWAYNFGWVGGESRYQADGSLTLGGYDKAKIAGPNVTLPLDPHDQLLVQVTDMILNLKNGTSISILGPSVGSSFQAIVDNRLETIAISNDIWQRFLNTTGSEETQPYETGRSLGPTSYWSMTVLNETAYDGDLTINIYPDLHIRIPNHQLVVPNVELNSQGQLSIPNATEVDVLLDALLPPNENDIPRLGRPFLSSTYLFVDDEKREFTLWPSQQTTNQELVALGPPQCNPAPPASSGGANTAPTSPAAPSSGSSHASAGTIAGATIGSIAGLALIIAAAAFVLRRRRIRRVNNLEQRKAEEQTNLYGKGRDNEDPAEYWKPEMSAQDPDKLPAQEMPLERNPAYSVSPYEMSSTSIPTPELAAAGTPRDHHRPSGSLNGGQSNRF